MTSIVEVTQEFDKFSRRYLGFYKVAIGLLFNLGADVFTLLKVGCNDDLCAQIRCFGWIAKGMQDVDACNRRNHDIKQNDVVLIGLGGGKPFLPIRLYVYFVASFREGSYVEFADKVLILYTENFLVGRLGSVGIHHRYFTLLRLVTVEGMVLNPAVGTACYVAATACFSIFFQFVIRHHGKRKCAALPGLTANPDVTVMCFYDGLC